MRKYFKKYMESPWIEVKILSKKWKKVVTWKGYLKGHIKISIHVINVRKLLLEKDTKNLDPYDQCEKVVTLKWYLKGHITFFIPVINVRKLLLKRIFKRTYENINLCEQCEKVVIEKDIYFQIIVAGPFYEVIRTRSSLRCSMSLLWKLVNYRIWIFSENFI